MIRKKSIRTARLVIRRFAATDWPALHDYLSDPEVVRFEPYAPLSERQSRQAAVHHSTSPDFWAVCLGDDAELLIGNISLSRKEHGNWELGYVFNRNHHGKGYASEAVKALLAEAFGQGGAHRIYAHCNPDNDRSWKLLERIGFTREGHLRKNVFFNRTDGGLPAWQDTYIYAMLAEEWRSNE